MNAVTLFHVKKKDNTLKRPSIIFYIPYLVKNGTYMFIYLISLFPVIAFTNVKAQNSEDISDSSVLNLACAVSNPYTSCHHLAHSFPSFQPLPSAAHLQSSRQHGLISPKHAFSVSLSVHPPPPPPLPRGPSAPCRLLYSPNPTFPYIPPHCCQSFGPRKMYKVPGPFTFTPACPLSSSAQPGNHCYYVPQTFICWSSNPQSLKM